MFGVNKMWYEDVCCKICTYVGEDQLQSGVLVDKRAKTIWHEVVLNGKSIYLDFGSNLSKVMSWMKGLSFTSFVL